MRSCCGGLFIYRTNRLVKIDIWQLGLFFRLLQLAIIGLVGFDIINRHGWSYTEAPSGVVNAWVEAPANFPGSTTPAYCQNAEHDYDYGSGWKYVQPECLKLLPEEAWAKSPFGAVTLTTSIIQSIDYAWACDGADAANKLAQCTALGAQVQTTGLQCRCTSTDTYYVQRVEDLRVTFEHGYKTSEKVRGQPQGHSVLGDSDLDTKVTFPNGTVSTYNASFAVTLTLAELLLLNETAGNLDSDNTAVDYPDVRGNDNKPKVRMTGTTLTVDIKYSNLVDTNRFSQAWAIVEESQDYGRRNVDATLDVLAEPGWAGSGPQTYYLEAPMIDAAGIQTHAKMTRYRQGVVVVFRAAGLVYTFDYMYLMSELLAAFLFLTAAAYVTDFIAFYLCPALRGSDPRLAERPLICYSRRQAPPCNRLPNGVSKVLRAKRSEKVSRVQTFAQLGLKAALAVKQFKTLAGDDQEFIEVKDVCRKRPRTTDTCRSAPSLLHASSDRRCLRGHPRGHQGERAAHRADHSPRGRHRPRQPRPHHVQRVHVAHRGQQ